MQSAYQFYSSFNFLRPCHVKTRGAAEIPQRTFIPRTRVPNDLRDCRRINSDSGRGSLRFSGKYVGVFNDRPKPSSPHADECTNLRPCHDRRNNVACYHANNHRRVDIGRLDLQQRSVSISRLVPSDTGGVIPAVDGSHRRQQIPVCR